MAQGLRTVLIERDADPEGLVRAAELDPRIFDGRSLSVPFVALGRLFALAAERTRCPHLGLLVGQHADLGSLGLVGLLMRHCATVGDALRALEAHIGVQDRGAVVGLGIEAELAVLSYAPHEPVSEGAALQSERALAVTTNILRALCGSDWVPLEVLLPRSVPPDTGPYQDFFCAPVRFDQEMAALVFPAPVLALPIAGADPAIRRRVEDQVRCLEAAQPHTLADDLRQYLRTAVTRRRCRAERVARLKFLHRRTLSRRLRAEGTSFRRLANEVQFQVAKQLLTDTTMGLAQISAVLDFSEPAAFTHAFRRWSGTTPSAWRKANRPADLSRRPEGGP
ncbi:AraC-like DNA-binding protein [Methylobacterium sp. BE186]|uniref:AraC family transcriptional regulator n=1 Tax=Methylobacterium sp. BE186 TaxID=2817715 RepID=UPI0028650BF0|nr:AraC family transcriptional regulator [Methylobacterium sp. BE186]MDR7039578.1 AraC-like DNA-binding protein [Methylobacterium sp. BE186]